MGTMRKLFHVEQSFFLLVSAMAADWWWGVLGFSCYFEGVRIYQDQLRPSDLQAYDVLDWELFHVEQFGNPGSTSLNFTYEAFQSK